MNLYEKIITIYSDLTQQDFISTITLKNDSDGKGDYIASWNHTSLTEPTKEQLDALEGVEFIQKIASVKMRQARLALHAAGLLDDVESRIAAMPKEAQIDWEFAETVERSSALVMGLTQLLGLTEDKVDKLFYEASKL